MRSIAILSFSSALLIVSSACRASEPEIPFNLCGEEAMYAESEDLTQIALDGSSDAALKLFWASLDNGKMEDALYWAQIAMENGSEVGRHNYASLLVQKGDARSLSRAKYHLTKLAAGGDRDAAVLLREAEHKLLELP